MTVRYDEQTDTLYCETGEPIVGALPELDRKRRVAWVAGTDLRRELRAYIIPNFRRRIEVRANARFPEATKGAEDGGCHE